MKVIYTSNVNGALRRGLRYLKAKGVEEPSRNGPVLVAPVPVTTVYQKPWQRVLFNATRDANPFFHLMEALWMLHGRDDVAYPAHYAAQMQLYSDDNKKLNGAYGFRWRRHFGYDQIHCIIDELGKNPASRRCVLAMWDASEVYRGDATALFSGNYEGDLKRGIGGGKDIPCNTHAYFRVQDAALEMTVCNRSNDVVWGAYGANAVHFSMLQEYIAAFLSLRVGRYYQVANNFHVYRDRPDVERLWTADLYTDLYKLGMKAVRMFAWGERKTDWGLDLRQFLECRPGDGDHLRVLEPRTQFFRDVVFPMAKAHAAYKAGDIQRGLAFLDQAPPSDWIVAGTQWLCRREVARAAKEAGAL